MNVRAATLPITLSALLLFAPEANGIQCMTGQAPEMEQ